MKGHLWGMLALCFLLTGCAAREPENRILVRILAVDAAEEEITLTAYSGVQDLGQKPFVCLTASGKTLSAALDALRTQGEGYPSLTHMTQLVVGDGVDLENLLQELVEGRETGYSATVWRTAGRAAEVLAVAEAPTERLEAVEENSGVAAAGILETLVTLKREGSAPVPTLRGVGEDFAAAGRRGGG